MTLTDALQSLRRESISLPGEKRCTGGYRSARRRAYTVDYLAMRVGSGATIVSRGTQPRDPVNSSFNGGLARRQRRGTEPSSSLGATGTDIIQSSSQADVWGWLTQTAGEHLSERSSTAPERRRPWRRIPGVRARIRVAGPGLPPHLAADIELVDVTGFAGKAGRSVRAIALFASAINRQVFIKAQVVEVSLIVHTVSGSTGRPCR